MIAKTAKPRVHDSYLELVKKFPLASIKSHDELRQAQKIIDNLLRKGKLDKGEDMYLDSLSFFVESYEDKHFSIGPVSDAEMLRHLMESKGVSQSEVHSDTGIPRSTISEILAGKRPFSKGIMVKLATYFHVDVSVFAENLAR